MNSVSDYHQNSGKNKRVAPTPFTGRHKPIHGGLTVPIQDTDTREKGGHDSSLRAKLRFSGNQYSIDKPRQSGRDDSSNKRKTRLAKLTLKAIKRDIIK